MADAPLFELGVYDASDEDTCLLRDLLDSGADLTWYDDNSSVIVLRDGADTYLREEWNFGALSRIAPQIDHVLSRLGQDASGHLRSAVMNAPVVPSLLFVPHGDRVAVELHFVSDARIARKFADMTEDAAFYAALADGAAQSLQRCVATLDGVELAAAMAAARQDAARFLATSGHDGAANTQP